VVKKEAAHYWAGTRLLGQEVKITGKIQWKVLNGGTLTRRERRQVSLGAGGERKRGGGGGGGRRGSGERKGGRYRMALTSDSFGGRRAIC
jgi:hypothetical protein